MANQPNETGSLILVHIHNNLVLLEALTDVDGKLYYKDKAVFPINNPDLLNKLTDNDGNLYYDSKPVMAPVKEGDNNALTLTTDGKLFVDNRYFLTKEQYDILSKFDYGAYLLTYDGKEVGLKASNASVETAINEVWTNIDNDIKYDWLKNSQGGGTT